MHKEEITRRVRRIVRWIPDCDPEDVLQKTFLRIKNAARYDPRRPFVPYAISVAWTVAIDEYRKRQREQGTRDGYARAWRPPSARRFELLEILNRLLALTFGGSLGLAPERVIVFSFAKLLEWKPRLLAEKTSSSLVELALVIEREFKEASGLPDAMIEPITAFRSSLADDPAVSEKLLVEYLTASAVMKKRDNDGWLAWLSDRISDWSYRAERVVLRYAVFDMPDIIGHLVEARLHPHEIIAYGCLEFLERTSEARALRDLSQRSLLELSDSIEKGCLSMVDRGEYALTEAFDTLRRRLRRRARDELTRKGEDVRYGTIRERNPQLAESTLRDYLGPNATADLKEWTDLVRVQIRGWFRD